MTDRISRRALLRLGAVAGGSLAFGGLLAGCSGSDDGETPTDASPTDAEGQTLATAKDLELTPDQINQIRERNLRMGFLTNNISDDFSRTLVEGGQKYAGDYGIELTVNSADFDADRQLGQFNALVQQRVDAIFLTAVNSDTIGTAVLRANQANIPVFVVGGAPARGEVVAVMNSASYDGCFEAGTALMRRIDKPAATIAILGIPFALQTIRDREKGILDAVGQAGGQVVSLQSDFSQENLLSLATNVIQANQNLDGIFATWSLAVTAAIEAVRQSGRSIAIAGYDSEQPGYQAFAQGNPNLVALSGQQAYLQGRAAIEGLCQSILGARLAEEIIVPNLLVTPENYREMWQTQYPATPAPF